MKKKIVVAAVAGALTLAAGQAFAFENEFHGMYKFFAYESNFIGGYGGGERLLRNDAGSGFFAEQRARLQYIAKASDDLKLVTHFELDSRFGGQQINTPGTGIAGTGTVNGYKGTYNGNDAGNLDADGLTLETKSVYLDFNCPITGTNMKIGIQPWKDAYQGVFLLADMTGVYATKKVIDPLTLSLGWFRYADNSNWSVSSIPTNDGIGRYTADLIVLDGKFAVTKDIVAGLSYYNIQKDTGAFPNVDLLHMVGLNAAVKVGPVSVEPFLAYQFGDARIRPTKTDDVSAWLAGAVTKTKVGPVTINASALYLSGDKDGNATSGDRDFKIVKASTSYFNAANMWILVRNGQQINTSMSATGNDITNGGRGLFGAFAGVEGTVDKVFYNANVGYARTAQKRNATEKHDIGTEINAQVGYKLYDNLSVSVAGAYAILGKGMKSLTATELIGGGTGLGVKGAANPYLTNVQLSYAF